MTAVLQSAGLVFGVTVVATMCVLRASRRWHLVDTPNERSAHVLPTPTLGGVGILFGVVTGLLLLPLAGLRWGLLACLLVLLAAVVDDAGRPLSVGLKLLLQAAAVVLWTALAPSTAIQVTTTVVVPAGWPAMLLSGLLLLWLMNVCNFMDGIDGLTGTQVIAMTAGVAWLPTSGAAAVLAPAIVAACLGFLPFNVPPARIFMGDVGSLSLGFLVGVTVLATAGTGVPLWIVALPLTLYAVDTTSTIVDRLRRGENVLQAHRQHLYQRLVQAGWGQGQVVAIAFAVTGLFAAASVLMAHEYWRSGLVCGLPASALLAAGVYWKERRSFD